MLSGVSFAAPFIQSELHLIPFTQHQQGQSIAVSRAREKEGKGTESLRAALTEAEAERARERRGRRSGFESKPSARSVYYYQSSPSSMSHIAFHSLISNPPSMPP